MAYLRVLREGIFSGSLSRPYGLIWLELKGHRCWLKAKGWFIFKAICPNLTWVTRPYGLICELLSMAIKLVCKVIFFFKDFAFCFWIQFDGKKKYYKFSNCVTIACFSKNIALNSWFFKYCLVAVLPRYQGFCNSEGSDKN